MESYMNHDPPMSQDIGNFYFDAPICKGEVILANRNKIHPN